MEKTYNRLPLGGHAPLPREVWRERPQDRTFAAPRTDVTVRVSRALADCVHEAAARDGVPAEAWLVQTILRGISPTGRGGSSGLVRSEGA